MQELLVSQDRLTSTSAPRDVLPALAAAFRRHFPVHATAAVTLALAMLVGSRTGNRPDAGVVGDYVFYIAVAIWLCGSAYSVYRILWLAAVRRDPSPLRAFVRPFVVYLSNAERFANTLNGLAALMMFIAGFSVLKGAIAILAPFSWDAALAEVDRILHFGRAPHEWLGWLTRWPAALFAINFSYHLWFVVLVGTLFTAAMAGRDSILRHRFLLSFMLVWLIGGFLVALGFSSAGPCYYERIGLGTAYGDLMAALASADRDYPLWALSTQDMLWTGYSGAGSGSIGISAFPSMHVASATLFALYASRRSIAVGTALWLFAAVIMVGSVVLGWHYAVDGYAGALIALAMWKAVGSLLARRAL